MSNSQEVIQNKSIQTLLISELDIKTQTNLQANIVKTTLIPSILLSQDMHIRKILGGVLYKKLIAEWIASNFNPYALPDGNYPASGSTQPIISGDTINYQELYEEIRNPLIWWSYVLFLPSCALKTSELGIVMGSTEFSESGKIPALDRLVSEGTAAARAYTQILVDYICETFPNTTDSTTVGTPSIGVYSPKKPWHPSKGCNCSC